MHTLISGPASEPVALADARLHLRLTATGSPAAHPDDSLVTSLITAARQHVEAVTGRALITQTWEMSLADLRANEVIKLPRAPIASVTSVKYYDIADSLQTFGSENYRALLPVGDTALPGRIELVDGAIWPWIPHRRSDAVVVRYVAGYGAAAAVPAAIKAAMLLMIGHLYENREAVVIGAGATELPMTVRALLAPYYLH